MDPLTIHAAATYPTTLAASTGIFDFITQMTTNTNDALKAAGTTAGVGFVVYQGIISKGALARILISLVVAGVFIWAIWNTDVLKNRVDHEFKAAGITATVTVAAPPVAVWAPDLPSPPGRPAPVRVAL